MDLLFKSVKITMAETLPRFYVISELLTCFVLVLVFSRKNGISSHSSCNRDFVDQKKIKYFPRKLRDEVIYLSFCSAKVT